MFNNLVAEKAKNYIQKKEIPQLFEALMSALMYHQPEDHVKYIMDCLQNVQSQKYKAIKWNTFIENDTKLGLLKNESNEARQMSARVVQKSIENSNLLTIDHKTIPQVPFIFLNAYPGADTQAIGSYCSSYYKGLIHISLNDLMKTQSNKDLTDAVIVNILLQELTKYSKNLNVNAILINGFPHNKSQFEIIKPYVSFI